MNCLVTGATGFIGAHLVRELVGKGHKVRIIARQKSKTELLAGLNIEIRYGDITKKSSIDGFFDNVDIVFHCAGLLGAFGIDKSTYYDVNVLGTKNVVDVSYGVHVKKFVLCSSAGVIGPTEKYQGDENSLYNPTNVYEQTKMEAEHIVKQGGLDYVILRPGFVYGEGDSHLLELCKALLKRQFCFIGKADAQLQPLYINDLVDAFLLCASNKIHNETYIIAGHEQVSVRDFIMVITQALGIALPRVWIPLWMAYGAALAFEFLAYVTKCKPLVTVQRVKFFTNSRVFTISKAERGLQFHPQTTVSDGVRKTINWYRRQEIL
ncbi:MAG: NAD-dependent epimerase/dehydratase family protein [Candidatus Omnitrophica bacterium]|nr:NAD-dependent epimerase/dehydratase family protein [Candidatus Omnitrophota bacterium]